MTTSESLPQIRVWIHYHRAIGVSTFYIFADGQVRRGLAVFRVQRGGAQLAEPAPSNFGAPGF